jgi:iron complex transport system substrate-binding protein
MKNTLKKLAIFCLIAAVFTGLLASCGETPENTAASPAVITDQLGRTVSLATASPQRIISLAPSNTEILYALGLSDRIVGVSDYSDYPPEAKTKPSVGAYDKPSIEQVIAMNPDLVLATEVHQATVIPQLESQGIIVVALSPQTLDDVLASITLIGKATGKVKEAAKLTAGMQQRINSVTNKTGKLSPERKPRVFYIVWNDPLMTAGAGTFIDELINKAGGINIAGDLKSYPTISLENVLTANPEVILAGSGMGEGEDLPYQYATTESRLQGTDARRNDRVYSINTDIVGRPGPRIVDALEDFLADIHPELRDQP